MRTFRFIDLGSLALAFCIVLGVLRDAGPRTGYLDRTARRRHLGDSSLPTCSPRSAPAVMAVLDLARRTVPALDRNPDRSQAPRGPALGSHDRRCSCVQQDRREGRYPHHRCEVCHRQRGSRLGVQVRARRADVLQRHAAVAGDPGREQARRCCSRPRAAEPADGRRSKPWRPAHRQGGKASSRRGSSASSSWSSWVSWCSCSTARTGPAIRSALRNSRRSSTRARPSPKRSNTQLARARGEQQVHGSPDPGDRRDGQGGRGAAPGFVGEQAEGFNDETAQEKFAGILRRWIGLPHEPGHSMMVVDELVSMETEDRHRAVRIGCARRSTMKRRRWTGWSMPACRRPSARPRARLSEQLMRMQRRKVTPSA